MNYMITGCDHTRLLLFDQRKHFAFYVPCLSLLNEMRDSSFLVHRLSMLSERRK